MSDNEDSNLERDGAQNESDEDFDYAEDNQRRGAGQANSKDVKAKGVENAHHDEEVEVSDGGSEVQSDPEVEQNEEEEEEELKPSPPKKPARFEPIKPSADSDDNDEDGADRQTAGAYNAADYANLPVSQEVKDLFKYITRFRPTTVELDTKLKAFIPDYIPAVGEVDAFLKPSKPDNQQENLGLLTIDEPCLNQSKESSVRIQMRAYMKTKVDPKRVVDSIENADKNPAEINRWIKDVSSIQRQPPSVGYSKPFPEIDALMEVWPQEIEDMLASLQHLPGGDLDMTTEEYTRLCCALVDIPVHGTNTGKNLIESLHVFFTLYSAFKENQHFQQPGNEQYVYEGGPGVTM